MCLPRVCIHSVSLMCSPTDSVYLVGPTEPLLCGWLQNQPLISQVVVVAAQGLAAATYEQLKVRPPRHPPHPTQPLSSALTPPAFHLPSLTPPACPPACLTSTATSTPPTTSHCWRAGACAERMACISCLLGCPRITLSLLLHHS